MKVDILAIGAHPDDAEISASGTLMKAARAGAVTAVVTLTRGEMGTRGTVEQRALEFDNAAALMGLSHHEMLTLPDGRLTDDEPSRLAVVRAIRELRPAIVLTHWREDRHPDHVAVHHIVQDAAFLAGLSRLDTGQEPHRPAELVFFMHTWEFEPSFVVDISDVMEEKKRAILCYESQVYNKSYKGGGPETYVSSRHFWELLMARAAHFGRLIGKSYGEPFKIQGLVEIDDLLRAFGGRHF